MPLSTPPPARDPGPHPLAPPFLDTPRAAPILRSMRWLWFGLVAVLGAVIDLVSKAIVFSKMPDLGDKVVLIDGLLAIETSENPGAAFGLFPGAITFFIVVSAVAVTAMVYFVATAEEDARLLPLTLGLLLAGVIGNLVDRVAFGKVRDFIAFYVEPQHETLHGFLMKVAPANLTQKGHFVWPNFNVADSCIVVGAFLIVIVFWREEKRAKADEAAQKEADADNKPADAPTAPNPAKTEAKPESKPETDGTPPPDGGRDAAPANAGATG